jgi:hypothetical protein
MADYGELNDGDVFMVEDIDPESWHVREVYAKFGLAMYQGQVLEHEIVNLIVWSGVSDGAYSSYKETQSANVEMFLKTMGSLKKVLMSRRVDLGHLESDLIKAVSLRNFLAHNYFRERAAAFMTHEGRDRMIAELEQADDFFQQLDASLTAFTRKMLDAFGLLDQMPQFVEEAQKTMGFGEPLPGLSLALHRPLKNTTNGKDRGSSAALFVTGKHSLRPINRVSGAVGIERSRLVGFDQRPSASIQGAQQRVTRYEIVLL